MRFLNDTLTCVSVTEEAHRENAVFVLAMQKRRPLKLTAASGSLSLKEVAQTFASVSRQGTYSSQSFSATHSTGHQRQSE